MSRATTETSFMRLALDEAEKGLGRTSPNPCVGAVIVKDGNVIATGYHRKAGTPHAEVHALHEAGDNARGATMYVTLEPCCHTGKTPPCSHAVAAAGITKVVVGMLDPNPLVDGGGRKYLIDHGVEVVAGVLEKECRSINAPFLKCILTQLPLIVLKAGASLDGRLTYQKGESGWITGEQSLHKVHSLRNEYDAILVGRTTVDVDNPSLTTRLHGKEGRDAVRVVLDTRLQTSPDAKVYTQKSAAPTLLFCDKNADKERKQMFVKRGVEVIPMDPTVSGRVDLHQAMRILAERGINSVLVEGGGSVHTSFLESELADKAILFYAPLFAGDGGSSLTQGLSVQGRSQAIRLKDPEYIRFGDDIMVEGDIEYPGHPHLK